MDAGLHIGLASWIHAQGGGSDFVVWPGLPVPLELGDLEVMSTMHDVVRAWEFAQLTNQQVREGQPVGAGSDEPLWVRHRRVLSAMDFAERPWTDEQDAELKAALSVLFEPGRLQGGLPVDTPVHAIYKEYQEAYADLERAGAPAADLATVLSMWVAAGHKLQVEAALGTVQRLTRQSSQPMAAMERTTLDPTLLLSTPNGSYAPTTVTPLSAVDPSTWLAGEATVDELGRAVGDRRPAEQWTSWRSNRGGTVRFRFMTLRLHRPWFTSSLYDQRDWRLPGGEIAAGGDGVSGTVPAYANQVYLAQVDSVGTTAPPAPTGSEGPLWPSVLTGPLVLHAALTAPPTPPARALQPGVLSVGVTAVPALHLSAQPVAGVARAGGPVAETGPATIRPVVRGPLAPAPALNLRPAVLGRVESLSMARVHQRLALAERLVGRPVAPGDPPPPPPPPRVSFIVGLGARVIPASPQPSTAYQWAS